MADLENLGPAGNGVFTFSVTNTSTGETVVQEDSEVNGNIVEGAMSSATGTLLFFDSDLTDTHAISFDLSSLSGLRADRTTLINFTDSERASLLAGFTAELSSTSLNQGELNWTYSISEGQIDFLSRNDSIDAVFTLELTDSSGGIVLQDVVISMIGTNDVPLITSPPDQALGSVAEEGHLELVSSLFQVLSLLLIWIRCSTYLV